MRATARLLALALLAAACSTGGGVDTTPAGSAGSGLRGVRLAAATSAQLDRVELVGLTVEEAMGVELWLRAEGGDIGVPLFVDGQAPYFMAPLAQENLLEGGRAELYLRDGGEQSPPLQLELSPLAPAPGAWDSFVEAFAGAIDRQARAAGSSFEELQSTPFDDVVPALIGMKLAQGYVDDGSLNDLESFPDTAELTDEDRAILDAVTAAMNLELLLSSPVSGLRSFTTSRAGQVPSTERAPVGSAASGWMPTKAGTCTNANIAVPDAEALSSMIETAKGNELEASDPRRDVLDRIGTFTTVGGFIPVVGVAIGGGGAAFIALETFLNGTAGLYPSSLLSLTSEIDLAEFPEDFTINGSWSQVMVTAASKGWAADVDIGRTALAALSTATAGLSNLSVADGFVLDVSLFLRDNAANTLIRDRAQENGTLVFCPQQWEVDVTGEPWSTGTAVLERFSVDPLIQVYGPIETGLNLPVDDTLRVQVDSGRFAGEEVHQDHKISVKPILLDAPAFVEVARPGDEFDLAVSITNATDPGLRWDAGSGGWRGDARLTAAGGIINDPATWERTHVTPSSKSQFPYLIVVEPTTNTGLRADDLPPRRKVVEVRLAKLIVRPDPGRVVKGGSLQFTATDADGQPADVSWSATGGQISAAGVYTAGDRPGVYMVTVVSKLDPTVTATATIEIVEADCVVGQWRLRTQEFLTQIDQAVGTGSSTQIGGEYIVTFGEDGTFTGQRLGWMFGVSSMGQQIVLTIDSLETGTWVVDETGTILEIDEASSDATVAMTMNGLPLPFAPQSIQSPGVSGQGSYQCSATTMTLTVTDDGLVVTAALDRIS
ncbi:MAG TPA: Ig-like domain-containing protein [Ilumatobacteraceae bacterium]|nr:Ig-like domain-containing protein [Ilumatobacteraceae bacterium]HRB01869.1 Ig-like domain-containing protein [Ilumatobacteraceae bacterium]